MAIPLNCFNLQKKVFFTKFLILYNQIGDKRQIFKINEIKPNEQTGLITVSNNGIMNPLDDALKNAVKQNLLNTSKEGVFVVYNPPTTNIIFELLYAAYDKNNDLLGGRLPLTNAEKTNIELYKYEKDPF